MTWDIEYGESHRFDMNQASGRTNRAFRDDPDVLMLLNAGFPQPEAFGARLLYTSERTSSTLALSGSQKTSFEA